MKFETNFHSEIAFILCKTKHSCWNLIPGWNECILKDIFYWHPNTLTCSLRYPILTPWHPYLFSEISYIDTLKYLTHLQGWKINIKREQLTLKDFQQIGNFPTTLLLSFNDSLDRLGNEAQCHTVWSCYTGIIK